MGYTFIKKKRIKTQQENEQIINKNMYSSIIKMIILLNYSK